MTTRRARRQSSTPPPKLPLITRFLQWVTSWEGIISLSVVAVLVVLAQGMLSFTLPFDLGKEEPPQDRWGYINVPRGSDPKLVFIGNVAGGASLEDSGASLAIQYALNEEGEVEGTQPELQIVEDSCNAEAAVAKAQEIVADAAVVGVITEACTASTLAARDVFEEAYLPYISISEQSPSLTLDAPLVTFRVAGSELLQTRSAVIYSRDSLGTSKALILYEDNQDMKAVADSFRSRYRASGGGIVDMRVLPASSDDWQSIVTQAKDFDVDFVYALAPGQQAGGLLSALREGGYEGAYMVPNATYNDPQYLATGDAALEGTYATVTRIARSAQYPAWEEAFKSEFLTVGPSAPVAYDAARHLLNTVIVAVEGGTDGSLKLGREFLAGYFRGLPYAGITGTLAFDANGDRADVLIDIMKYQDGAFSQVEGS